MKKLTYYPSKMMPRAKGPNHCLQFNTLCLLRANTPVNVSEEDYLKLLDFNSFLIAMDAGAIFVEQTEDQAIDKSIFKPALTTEQLIEQISGSSDPEHLRSIIRNEEGKEVRLAAVERLQELKEEETPEVKAEKEEEEEEVIVKEETKKRGPKAKKEKAPEKEAK